MGQGMGKKSSARIAMGRGKGTFLGTLPQGQSAPLLPGGKPARLGKFSPRTSSFFVFFRKSRSSPSHPAAPGTHLCSSSQHQISFQQHLG